MDSYIVRIIHRPDENDASLTGIVEDVENQDKTGFATQEELLEILGTINEYSNNNDQSPGLWKK